MKTDTAKMDRAAIKKKAKEVEETIADMKKYKTIALLTLDKLPDALFQALRKRIRESNGQVKVLRKAVLTRVLKSDKKLATKEKEAERPAALILTNLSPYELNRFFKENTKKRAAKINEVALFEIVVPAGETDLPPGPALSELKGAGINAQIKAGKIVVAADSVVAKPGERITAQKAKALQTLGVQPFTIQARMLFGYDREYLYESSLLDIGDTIKEGLAAASREAFSLSVNANYPTGQNIDFLLKDSYMQSVSMAINGKFYSQVSIDQALLSALLQGDAVSGAVPENPGATPAEKDNANKEVGQETK